MIFKYIEVWYNRLRRNSALDYLTPEQYEQQVRLDKFSAHKKGASSDLQDWAFRAKVLA
ncbi:IS3 family transposase [bacterium]|nr:IS3 family transposase [bacterium]